MHVCYICLFPSARQIPVFVSVFFGLRQLTNLPVMSLKDGGMLWFTDLSVADPYCILPAITSLTMLATIEVGHRVLTMLATIEVGHRVSTR